MLASVYDQMKSVSPFLKSLSTAAEAPISFRVSSILKLVAVAVEWIVVQSLESSLQIALE